MVPRLARRTLLTLAVLAGLILLPALATARPLGVAGLGGNVWPSVQDLLVGVGAKNGMSIDPHGATAPSSADGDNGMTIDPHGATAPSAADGDEGMSIDPHG